jgi:hypothetical protein
MTAVVIKKIGSETIWLKDKITNPYWMVIYALCLLNVVASLSLGFVNMNSPIWAIGWTGGALFIFIIGVACLYGMGYPSYVLFGDKGLFDGETIIKTDDPERDQKEICRAAKKIEEKLWEYENHRRELERIAGKCK